jgi:hypothetical protein
MTKAETAHGYIARDVHRRLRNGDKIGDNELMIAIPYFEQTRDMLYPLGEMFNLQAQEANRVAYTLRGFAVARELVNG